MAKENRDFLYNKKGTYLYVPKNISSVYMLVNDITKEFYIGSSMETNRRISHHFGLLRRGKSACRRLQESFDKYGYDNFSFYIKSIIEDETALREREIAMIEENIGNPLMLNTATTNGSWNNSSNPDLVKISAEKQSKSKLGKNRGRGGHPIVIDGVLYDSYSHAERKLGVNCSSIHNRVNSDSLVTINWYKYSVGDKVEVKDERFIGIPISSMVTYEIDSNIYYCLQDIADDYKISKSAVSSILKSDRFPSWRDLAKEKIL